MAIIIDTNFPGGGADKVYIGANGTITFSAPVDGSLTDRSLWFYFCVRGAKGKALCFIQQGMTHTLEPFYAGTYAAVRPVVREGPGGAFYRIPSSDTSFKADPISYTFTLTPKSDETYVAFCFPYQYADLLRFVETHSKDISLRMIGKTEEGRDYPVLLIGDDGNPKKKLIITTARQHSGESPGSFVLEGFLEQYLSENESGKYLRETSVLLVLPMTNLDGVEEGRYGKDAPPADFNRAWMTESIREELRSFLKLVDELLKIYKPGLYVDFHAPQPGGYSYVVLPRASVLGKEGWKRINLLVDLYEDLTRDRGSCRRQDLDREYINWGRDNYRLTATHLFSECYHIDAFSFESSYNTDCFGRYLSPEDWHFMGRQLCTAVGKIWFEAYDSPGVITSTTELLWDGWEMVSIPKNTMVTAKPKMFRAEALGDGASIFFADLHRFKSDEKGSYTLLCDNETQIICYVHYGKGDKIAVKSRPYYLCTEKGSVRIPFSLFVKEAYDFFQVAFNITSLKGSFSISHTG
ncbi:hypothetical protein AGMMS49546_21820 [Spirochaetia bacterium]|nr:hypothetical protein AGMMS49546_21820 [Spirochaetia bacterium]